ncbi:hypothetical protein BOTBODRAFT_182251 [Botryobasidium botryosum FD-172 SS1]|uniref:F-box domain-containing protein n=1 Tax=Botryobasidium botryosum (strain FD-172 SS1) TaxID=930990 RepID=A0A067LRY2_BOTB1|nr:hypothetical protein BOTBODRAFT_182251 [Botryobasidium botryosum FD-172 SS1]
MSCKLALDCLQAIFEAWQGMWMARVNSEYAVESQHPAMEAHQAPAHIVSAVCRQWRSAALHTPCLWNTIIYNIHSLGKWQALCLRRSSPVSPLCITFHFGPGGEGFSLHEATEVLASLDIRHRWLDLRVTTHNQPWEVSLAVLEHSPIQIRALSLSVFGDQEGSEWMPSQDGLDQKLHAISYLSLTYGRLPFASPAFVNLTELRLSGHMPTGYNVLDVLAGSPGMKALILDRVGGHGHVYASLLDNGVSEGHVQQLPTLVTQLEHLVFRRSEAALVHRLLAGIEAPALTTFFIQGGTGVVPRFISRSPASSAAAFLIQNGSKLRHLTWTNLAAPEGELLDQMLEATPGVTTSWLAQTGVPEFASALRSTGGWPLLESVALSTLCHPDYESWIPVLMEVVALASLDAKGASFDCKLLFAGSMTHRLPADCLQAIFEAWQGMWMAHIDSEYAVESQHPAMEARQGPAQIVGAVCRQWRSVALHTPCLWSTIVYDSKSPGEWQELCLRRSGPVAPLCIIFHLSMWCEEGRLGVDNAVEVLAALDPRHRWLDLRVTTWERPLEALLALLECSPIPIHALDFSVQGDINGDLEWMQEEDAWERQLQTISHLRFHNDRLPFASMAYAGLTELCLSSPLLTSQGIFDALTQSPGLKTLILDRAGGVASVFGLADDVELEAQVPHATLVTRLEHLVFRRSEAALVHRLLAGIEAPALTTFFIQGGTAISPRFISQSPASSAAAFLVQNGSKLRHLTWTNLAAPEGELLDQMLEATPGVTTSWLAQTGVPEFASALRSTGGWPLLESVALSTLCHPDYESWIPVLMEVVRSRGAKCRLEVAMPFGVGSVLSADIKVFTSKITADVELVGFEVPEAVALILAAEG